ncbi:MAG TPA: TIGR02588 family protein [Coleofasciculaceae cyanobacterium]
MNDTNSSQDVEQKPQRSPAEWTTFTIALFILASIVGLVFHEWLTQDHKPPVLSVNRPGEIRQAPGQYYVPFEVINKGGETAESVQVIAELRINDEVEESGEQQIDFLASGEKEEGAFVFSRDPRQGELTVRVASYKLP